MNGETDVRKIERGDIGDTNARRRQRHNERGANVGRIYRRKWLAVQR